MKKILSLMLVLICIVSMVACGQGGTSGNGPGSNSGPSNTTLDVFAAAAKTDAPTKIVSLTTYTGKDLVGKTETLSGAFTQVANGNNSILDFKYERYATIEEEADSHKVTVEGAIAVKDGKTKTIMTGAYAAGASDWAAVIPSLQQLGAFKLNKTDLPADYTLNSDGSKLTVSLSREEALKVIGVVIDATGEISLEALSNGKNISQITISYTAASGASVKVTTSYTYGTQTLDFSRFN